MIIKALGQLLLAVTLFHAAPFDAAVLEARADESKDLAQVAHLILVGQRVYLPKAGDRVMLPPIKKDLDSYGVVTSADSTIVIDVASGATLYAEAPDDVRPMGSITKLMSAMVFFDTKPNLDSTVTLIKDDYVGGGRVYLKFDDAVLLRSVLGASLVGSDNTATHALARLSGLGDAAFIQAMNDKAAVLGMQNSHFVDTSGLSSDNASTARDLSILLRAAKKYSTIAAYMTKNSYDVTQHDGFTVHIPSTDLLLSSPLNTGDYIVTAGKTGYIPEAGYCLATAVEHDGHEIIIVVLGAEAKDDRFNDAAALATWSFNTFVWPKL